MSQMTNQEIIVRTGCWNDLKEDAPVVIVEGGPEGDWSNVALTAFGLSFGLSLLAVVVGFILVKYVRSIKPSRQMIAVAIVASGVIVTIVVLTLAFLCQRLADKPQMPMPEAPVPPAEVRVKAVERKAELQDQNTVAAASGAVAIACGLDEATADRYEARNDALRSIARRRDLATGEVDALLAYLRAADDNMRVERVAALKNDVMNVLRNQEPPVEGLAETLIVMFKSGEHPPEVLDYCIQHLGAMVNELDDATRGRVREVFVRAAGEKGKPYAGTALYSLAEDRRATSAQDAELRRLTVALCKPSANNTARIAAIQLAGQRGYIEALPIVRETLSAPRRDAVLDIVCLGSLGLLGNSDDMQLASQFANYDTRRAVAAKAAIKRIKERTDAGNRF